MKDTYYDITAQCGLPSALFVAAVNLQQQIVAKEAQIAAVQQRIQELEPIANAAPDNEDLQQRLTAREQLLATLHREKVLLMQQQAGAAGSLGLLTERKYIGQPLPMLQSRTSDRASTSRTRPSNPSTWSELKPWADFKDRAQQMHAELDDVNPCFEPMVIPNLQKDDDGTVKFGLTAASEDDVKGLLNLHVLQGVTQVARRRNLGKSNPCWSAAC